MLMAAKIMMLMLVNFVTFMSGSDATLTLGKIAMLRLANVTLVNCIALRG